MKTKFVALLRGINVSGQKKIKMAELKKQFESLKFENVVTYIQSGNIIFNSTIIDKEKNAIKIKKMISTEYEFEVEIMILAVKDIEFILKNNPFNKNTNDDKSLYVTLLFDDIKKENLDKFKNNDYSPEEYKFIKNIVFLNFPNGYGRAKLTNNFIENKLKVSATTRNWKTMNKLLKLATEIS